MSISSYHYHVAKLKDHRKNTISCTKYIYQYRSALTPRGMKYIGKEGVGHAWMGSGKENVNTTVITRYELLQH